MDTVVDEKGFKAFLKEGRRVPKNLKEGVIRDHVRFARRFEEFLAERPDGRPVTEATAADVKSFLKALTRTEENTWDNLIGLLRYSRFINNREMELELLITLDGGDVLQKLLDVAKDEVGKPKYDEIFAGFVLPPLGTPQKDMPDVTRDFMQRIQKGTGAETTKSILLAGVHGGPPEAYADEVEMLRAAGGDVDGYLARRRQRMIDLLAEHMEKGTLFYTQPIDKKALDFVRKNPEVAGGVRKGKYIYQTKIPYMMVTYLREKNPTKRRYQACHCPLARESIMSGADIPRDFCYCSAGYEKKPYEAAFGEPVKTVVLKSVLWGDDVCRFRMEIPKKYLGKKADKTRRRRR